MSRADFVLASASPRRRELLQQIGARFAPHPVDVDERRNGGESPEDYVLRLALTKAEAGRQRNGALPVLGADTTVVVDGDVLGKPQDEGEAVDMLLRLSGRSHRVLTAVALVSAAHSLWRVSDTRVTFAPLTQARCRAYWRTGEPVDKAGAYAIQGLGAVFVTRLEGSYSGVVGLPLAETCELLDAFSISYWRAGAEAVAS
ncbi:MAG: Maf family protein [Pseudomonas sp.]